MADILSIDDDLYFMAIAHLAALRSSNNVKVGACIVNARKQIVGTGYFDREGNREHAEAMAIKEAIEDVKNCTIYVTLHPCNRCAEIINKHGITKVVYNEDHWPDIPVKILRDWFNIECFHYVPQENLEIKFNNIQPTSDENEIENHAENI